MRADTFFIIRFYIPLLVSGFLVILATVIRAGARADDAKLGISVPLLTPLVGLSIPLPWSIRYHIVVRTALGISSFGMIWLAFSTDLSNYFPSTMRMTVFFDNDGIERTLSDFSTPELLRIGIPRDWSLQQQEYDEYVRHVLAGLWSDAHQSSDTAYVRREYLHAEGETTFVVERMGFLSYRITESTGILKHTVDAPGKEIRPFWTFFTLRETADNYIRPGLIRLLVNPNVAIYPQFKQNMSLDPRHTHAVPFDHIVIGMTKVRLAPYPQFGNTIYLWKSPTGQMIPVGYAVYY